MFRDVSYVCWLRGFLYSGKISKIVKTLEFGHMLRSDYRHSMEWVWDLLIWFFVSSVWIFKNVYWWNLHDFRPIGNVNQQTEMETFPVARLTLIWSIRHTSTSHLSFDWQPSPMTYWRVLSGPNSWIRQNDGLSLFDHPKSSYKVQNGQFGDIYRVPCPQNHNLILSPHSFRVKITHTHFWIPVELFGRFRAYLFATASLSISMWSY